MTEKLKPLATKIIMYMEEKVFLNGLIGADTEENKKVIVESVGADVKTVKKGDELVVVGNDSVVKCTTEEGDRYIVDESDIVAIRKFK